ncbi:hypothetical protein Scep_026744 [Stephania cephalantha]|uniref:Uncharacterized protein n=1 Tax=Stephania cephalantha TaxID=152367 RepID=A0AAP0EKR2_9MAGN
MATLQRVTAALFIVLLSIVLCSATRALLTLDVGYGIGHGVGGGAGAGYGGAAGGIPVEGHGGIGKAVRGMAVMEVVAEEECMDGGRMEERIAAAEVEGVVVGVVAVMVVVVAVAEAAAAQEEIMASFYVDRSNVQAGGHPGGIDERNLLVDDLADEVLCGAGGLRDEVMMWSCVTKREWYHAELGVHELEEMVRRDVMLRD